MSREASDKAFWTFSLDVYARDGVAPACLRLQDRYGIDVNLLLYCCWTGSLGIRLEGDDIARALALTRDWKSQVVEPLRSVRRILKGGFQNMPDAASQALRREVAKLELESERIEQEALQSVALKQPVAGADPRAIMLKNIQDYCATEGATPDAAAQQDIALLVDSALA